MNNRSLKRKIFEIFKKIFKKIPVLSQLIRYIEGLEEQNRKMKEYLADPFFDSLGKNIGETASAGAKADRLPLPPSLLREWVAGTPDLDWFLEGGRLGAETLVSTLKKNGIPIEQMERVLDFGCGCGRVIRHFVRYPSVRWYGTDFNKTAIYWCNDNLDFAEFGTNRMAPPTRYHENSFDLVFAFSVFTHLTEELQWAWMDELRRILKPDGLLLITVHGDSYFPQIADHQKETYRKGMAVFGGGENVGENSCVAFHPESYVRNVLAKRFAVVDFIPQGALGNPTQDLYILRAKD